MMEATRPAPYRHRRPRMLRLTVAAAVALHWAPIHPSCCGTAGKFASAFQFGGVTPSSSRWTVRYCPREAVPLSVAFASRYVARQQQLHCAASAAAYRWGRREPSERGICGHKSLFSLHSASNGIEAAENGENEVLSSSSEEAVDGELTLTNGQLLFNAVLLVTSFSFALLTILKVDEGMTRGWTQAEIMMRIPIDNWKTYEFNLHESPIETKTFINVIIYLLGDWLSQTVFKKKNILEFDAAQTIKNGFIGLCFGPLVHAYYEFSDLILPVDVTINRLYKILMDQSIYLSVKCSMYIVAVGLLSGISWEDSIQSVRDRIKGVMFTAWKFWPLVHCVTYGLIPARHRILWVNCVDLVWNAILASMAREDADLLEEDAVQSLIAANETEVAPLAVVDEHFFMEESEFADRNGSGAHESAKEVVSVHSGGNDHTTFDVAVVDSLETASSNGAIIGTRGSSELEYATFIGANTTVSTPSLTVMP